MCKGTAKSFQRMEPLMKGCMRGHFLPINIALTASKDINLVVGKEGPELHSLGVVECLHWEASYIHVTKMKAVGTGEMGERVPKV